MSYAYKTGVVDTTSTNVSITPGAQQAAFLHLTNGLGQTTPNPTVLAVAASTYNTFNVTAVQGAAAFQLCPADSARSNLSLNYQGTGIILVGSQAAVTAGTPGGYALASGMSVNLGAAQQAVWCVVQGNAGDTGIVSVATASSSS